MRTVTKTALANVKQNKGRNILSGIAICLTTILLYLILTIGFGTITLQFEAINRVYPTWHMMYRDVSEDKIQALKLHVGIETLGLRQDVAEVVDDEATIILTYADEVAYQLNRIELEEGDYPKNKEDIIVSQGLLDALGFQAELGDNIVLPYQIFEKNGKSLEKQGTFHICGIIATNEANIQQNTYSGLISRAFMEEQVPEEERSYWAMFRIMDADKMTTDEIESRAKEIALGFEIDEANVLKNNEYLLANYIDPSFYIGIAVILLVVVFAGILTIYSIYYVSMVHKVQEFGKLKALGATKKQIRQIVFQEGFLVAGIAIPIGLILGFLFSNIFYQYFMEPATGTNAVSQMMMQLIQDGTVTLFKPWIVIVTVIVSSVTVYLSLLKPMKTASKISPIEALRYGGVINSKAKTRNGYINLSLVRLAKANLFRNRKRTAITIITLGMTGILFIVVATVLTCADPKEIAREHILSDYQITIESWHGDQMHPEREWSSIQQNNPLNDTFEQQVQAVSGVDKIQKIQYITVDLNDFMDGDNAWRTGITGLTEECAEELEEYQIQGQVTYEELKAGNKIVLSKIFLRWFPNVKIGDYITMTLYNGEEEIQKTFEIAAVGDYSYAFTGGSSFVLPSSVIEDICYNNMVYSYEITVNKEEISEAGTQLQSIVDNQKMLKMNSYEAMVAEWENAMDVMSKMGYAFMIVLAGVGIMNLINTMINSIYTRKRELGMMQAIGLSEHQLIQMLQMEGLFYTLGTLIISLGIGNMVGYGVFLYAKADRLLNITRYHYPLTQTILLTVTVIVLQLLLTLVISRNFRKQSLIDRIRFSE